MKITIKEIAEKAGVSKATVSRVLNNSKPVSEEIRVRVMQVVEEYHFKPSTIARSLSLRKSHLIGIIIPDLSNPVFSAIISGIESHITNSEYALVIAATAFNPEKKREQILMFQERGVDGLILITDDGEECLDVLLEFDKPLVMIGTGQINDKFPVIKIDNFKAASDVVRLLVSRGHTHIGMIRGPLKDVQSGYERFNGFKETMDYYGLYKSSLVTQGLYTFEAGYMAMVKLIEQNTAMTAVFCASDIMAVGAMRAAMERGYKIPEDIAFVGFDDIEIARMVTPSLTTVRQPFKEKGQRAMGILLAKIEANKDDIPPVSLCEYDIIERESAKLYD